MKKSTIRALGIALGILLIAILGCCLLTALFGGGFHVRAKLVVNGAPIKEKCIIYRRGETYLSSLPMLAVLEALGNRVTVLGDGTKAVIDTRDAEYIFSEHRLCNDDDHLVCEVPGKLASFLEEEGRPGELYVEHNELLQVFRKMGVPNVNIVIDPKGKEVTIDYTERTNARDV